MGLVFDGKSGTGDPERDEAVIVYYGDGASSQGDVHEAMVFAASYQTPAGLLPAEQPVGHLGAGRDAVAHAAVSSAAQGYGIPSIRVDGNDVLASYAVTRVALDEARAGGGPARDRGADLPDGRAHHERRPDEVPHLRRGGLVGAARPDRADAGVPARAAARRTRSSPTSRPRRRPSPTTPACARSSSAASRPASCSTTSTASRTRSSTSSAPGSPTTRPRSRRGT